MARGRKRSGPILTDLTDHHISQVIYWVECLESEADAGIKACATASELDGAGFAAKNRDYWIHVRAAFRLALTRLRAEYNRRRRSAKAV